MAVGELTQPPQEESLVGKVVSDRYRIIKKLGEGGMGAVYLAEHVFIEKKVALKVLSPEFARKADLTARFLQEAKSASRIGHENVIDISDFGQSAEGLVYFAMEYLKGQDLGQAVSASGAMSWARAKPIVIQVCKALGAAHAQGIIHRDMKPENVFLIDKEGRRDFVKLLDFGIAKVQTEGDDGPKLTRTGMIFGTPEYMAPEQAEGKVCDQRADLYAVGCVINHLICGRPPFQAENFVGLLTKHLLEQPQAPSVLNPSMGITPQLDALVLKALSKKPEQRYQSMAELRAAVEAIPAGDELPGAPRGNTQTPTPGSMTRPIGGADVQPVIANSGRVSSTEIHSEDVMSSYAERTEFVAGSKPAGKMALVIGGVAVGVVVAVGWLLFGRLAPVAQPTPAPASSTLPAVAPPTPTVLRAPTPAPAATVETAEAEAKPAAPESPEASKVKSARPRHEPASPKYRRIEAPPNDIPATVPGKSKGPGLVTPELKDFPGQ